MILIKECWCIFIIFALFTNFEDKYIFNKHVKGIEDFKYITYDYFAQSQRLNLSAYSCISSGLCYFSLDYSQINLYKVSNFYKGEVMKSQQQIDFEYKPITLQTNYSTRQLSKENKVHQYHKLIKMKRLLADTEQKMKNRIELFKKASEKIMKKREIQYKTFNKIENAKKHPFFLQKIKSRAEVKTAEGRRLRDQRRENVQMQDTRLTAQRIFQERLQNARNLKQEKQRFKIIIEQRKKIQHQRKLESASCIRKKRQNAKIVKEQLQNERKQDFYRQMNEKYQRQREEFLQLERHLNQLQIEEEQALLDWKKTMDNRTQIN